MTQQGHDSIWVIVDRLTKSTRFLPVNTGYHAGKYAELYVSQVMRLHGGTKDHNLRSGTTIYSLLLGTLAQGLGN